MKRHAGRREEIDKAEAGDIVAIMGLDCASGDTYAPEANYATLENMFVAEPVIKMSINPLSRDGADRLSKALQRRSKRGTSMSLRQYRSRTARPSWSQTPRSVPCCSIGTLA